MLSSQQAQAIWTAAGLIGQPTITRVKEHNHIYRLGAPADTLYLKIYTKSWYGDDSAGTAYCVDHEVAAWDALREAGLSVPDVLTAALDVENPIGRPYLLTRALPGASLTALITQAAPTAASAMLQAVGDYLRQMHTIRYPYPGYITSAGLHTPPDPDGWQHPIWTFAAWEKECRQVWEHDSLTLPAALLRQMQNLYEEQSHRLADQPPCFTHGDCHASQFFLVEADGHWQVSGVVDMEVASAGDCGHDWLKLLIEMAVTLPAAARWWEPLFEGYGAEPALDLLRLRLVAAGHDNYAWVWPGNREQILRHILSAATWHDLLDLTALRNSIS